MSYESPWMNDELRMYREVVRKFVETQLAPNQARWVQQRHPDVEAWSAAGQTGLLLTDIPQEYGGGGGTFAHEVVVLEELARAHIRFATVVQSVAAHYIFTYGSETQKRAWLPRLAKGELIGAVAITEPNAGSDVQGVRTTARRDGGHYVLKGQKTFITNGALAGLVVVAVKTDPKAPGTKGLSLVVVETKDLEGFQLGRIMDKVGMHTQDTCELFFDDARVPASNLLGPKEGLGYVQMMEQLPFERLAIGARALATAEQAVAITSKYVKDRRAFGQSLIEFQNTRFKLAECATEAHVGRVFLDSCVQRYVAGKLDPMTAAMAKVWFTDSQCRVVDECLQLHGGYGYLTEYPIARMWADSRVERIYAGANEILKEVIGWTL